MKKIKITSISDIHGDLSVSIPKSDILTISGDICPVRGSHNPNNQLNWINKSFIPWTSFLIEKDIVKDVVFIAGNHDFVFEKFKNIDFPNGVHYLFDSNIELYGVKIHGTPWTPTFGNWAFMGNYGTLERRFKNIPNGIDILLSHGPIYGYNDTIMQEPRYDSSDPHIGSKALYDNVIQSKPKMVLVGHIHSGSHEVEKIPLSLTEYIESVNVSIMDEDYIRSYVPYQTIIMKD